MWAESSKARPDSLPILQPIKFELVIKPKAAKALGLKVPDSCKSRDSDAEL